MSTAQAHYEQWPAAIAKMKKAAPEVGRALVEALAELEVRRESTLSATGAQ